MARQVIQQPDGKWAIWSTVVDDFVYKDCTEKQLVKIMAEEAYEAELARIKSIVEDIKAGKTPYHQFQMTYDEAVSLRNEIHGEGGA